MCEEIGLTPDLLQTSHLAARLNGYLAGVGQLVEFEKDILKFGLPEKVADYVREQWEKNKGGSLYC